MLRVRLLLLLAVSFLMASAVWADDVGYVDCSAHPDGSPVYAKARQSQDTVGTVACGERFTVLLYGFIFSRIQTSDNKVGYVFSNLISIDRSTAAVPRSSAPRMVASSKAPSNGASPTISTASERTPVPAEPRPAAPAPQAAPAQSASVQQQPAAVQPAPAQPAPAEVTLSASAPASAAPSAAAQSGSIFPDPPRAPAQPQSVADQPAAAPSASASAATSSTTEVTLSAAPAVSAPETRATEPAPAAPPSNPPAPAQPEPAAAQPQPAPQPEVAPVRDATVRSSWERPNPTGRRQSLIEVFGGYTFTRFDNGGGTFTNLNGFMGAFAINIKPWVQFAGDSSYNFVTTNGVKTTLYGNHYGPRFFYRVRNRWNITPFGEAFIGGTRLATSVSGTGGYSTSDNEISYKFGGGIDMNPSKHFEIRIIDFDYYRTAFGTNLHQNNYWATAGIVLRFFGGRGE